MTPSAGAPPPDPPPAEERAEERLHRALGLTDDEFEAVGKILGRTPNHLELALYAVMWSEHCSYKSSRLHLRRLPTEGPRVLVGPGENAGVIDAGDGIAVALRIESHNHPSAIEPYQGAATGVGGILRDIFTMGARPLAVMDPLFFGPPDDARQRWLVEGVVSGISGYGNSVGVPTVGGELTFDRCYAQNPLVNVLCMGALPAERLVLGIASGPGNLAVLLGSSTGRDGIGGVSVLASAGFNGEQAGAADDTKRPSVQVGDPFEEKRLIEACLELLDTKLVVGIQDLGGAGLACATSETAAGEPLLAKLTPASRGSSVALRSRPYTRAVFIQPYVTPLPFVGYPVVGSTYVSPGGSVTKVEVSRKSNPCCQELGAVTVSVTVVFCWTPPPVPVAVMGYVPIGVLALTVIVIVELPEPGAGIGLGLKLTVVPDGAPEADKLMGLSKPLLTVVVIVEVPWLPC